jgi:hypothetical protein
MKFVKISDCGCYRIYDDNSRSVIFETQKIYISDCGQYKVYEQKSKVDGSIIKQLSFIHPTIKCDCGGQYRDVPNRKAKHELTKKHQAFISHQ